ncbi:polyprenyl synthetase family protein [Sorangium sp. So ce134]
MMMANPVAPISHFRSPTSMRSYEDIRQRYAGEIERRLLESQAGAGLIGEMISYHLSTGGKRIRAMLPIWICENLGGPAEDAIDLGVGLELLHNATLVHDDLQDGDTHRRGRPAVWHRWGSAQAINAGDALIFHGFARIARSPPGPRLVPLLSDALLRLVQGQAMEFQLQALPGEAWAIEPMLETWEVMARHKTGALFAVCLCAGAVAAEAGEATIEEAARYGEDIGLLFQVQDDYIDLVGNKGRKGKLRDLLEGKLSFPVVWAYKHASPAAVEPIRAILGRTREDRTYPMALEAFEALQRCGALEATAAWLRSASKSAEEQPLAEIVPGLAACCLSQVAGVLDAEAESPSRPCPVVACNPSERP